MKTSLMAKLVGTVSSCLIGFILVFLINMFTGTFHIRLFIAWCIGAIGYTLIAIIVDLFRK